MGRKILVALVVCFIAAGCMAGLEGRAEAVAPEEVKRALRENPGLLLEILREHKAELFEIVQQGALEKRQQEETARLRKDLDNPKKPAIDTARPMLGSADADLTIVEYSDFFCPYCGRGAESIKKLIQDNPGKYRVYFKHLPLHKNSQAAARIFEALSLQNPDLAWRFHDEVFAKADSLAEADPAALLKVAESLEPDMARLKKDMDGVVVDERINADMEEANAFGIRGTPGFVVGGVLVMGAYPKAKFEEVAAMVREHRKNGGAK